MHIADPLSLFPAEEENPAAISPSLSTLEARCRHAQQRLTVLSTLIEHLTCRVKELGRDCARVNDVASEVGSLAAKLSAIEVQLAKLSNECGPVAQPQALGEARAHNARRRDPSLLDALRVWTAARHATLIAGLAVPVSAAVFVGLPFFDRYFAQDNRGLAAAVPSRPPAHITSGLTPPTDEPPAEEKQIEPAPVRAIQRSDSRPVRFIARLAVDSEPGGAAVRINQRHVGTTPLLVRRQAAGTHAVWIEHEGYQRWTGAVLMPADKLTKLVVRLQPDPKSLADTKSLVDTKSLAEAKFQADLKK